MDGVITDNGFNDIEAGAELFSMMKLDAANLKFPSQKMEMMEIADFVNEYGEEGLHQLRMVALLSRFSQFVNLQKKRVSLATQVEQIDKELNLFR